MSNKFGKDSLGDRMKAYEAVPKNHLIRRMPVIIRLDGVAFHTFTKHLDKPFDEVLKRTMQSTMFDLCKSIQGCVFGYTQSDEITLVLTDYQTYKTSAWFDYGVEKLCSVSAAMCTRLFNKYFAEYTRGYVEKVGTEIPFDLSGKSRSVLYHENAAATGAIFDARCFNLTEEEVANCIIWRQDDAVRNSVQGLGQKYFSSKQLHGKSCEAVKQMLADRTDAVVWDELGDYEKNGICYVLGETGETDDKGKQIKSWKVFSGVVKNNRHIVEDAINVEIDETENKEKKTN